MNFGVDHEKVSFVIDSQKNPSTASPKTNPRTPPAKAERT